MTKESMIKEAVTFVLYAIVCGMVYLAHRIIGSDFYHLMAMSALYFALAARVRGRE